MLHQYVPVLMWVSWNVDQLTAVLPRRAVEEKIISVACTQMGAGDAIYFLNAAFLFVLQDKIIQDLG